MEPTYVIEKFIEHVIYEQVLERFRYLFRAVGGKGTDQKDVYSVAKSASVLLRHRRESIVHDRLYAKAFESGARVLIASIMSKHSLDEMAPHLQVAKQHRTVVRALTWDPNIPREVMEAFRKHLGEYKDRPAGALEQVKDAAVTWKRLASEWPTVLAEVRKYDSSPTMQGILVEDQWALVELMPFHRTTGERPALYLVSSIDTELFALFQSAFRDLFDSARPL
jgi:hypothetical protein